MAASPDPGTQKRQWLMSQHLTLIRQRWAERSPSERVGSAVVVAALDDPHGRTVAEAWGNADRIDVHARSTDTTGQTPCAIIAVARDGLAAALGQLGHARAAAALTHWPRPADIPVLILAGGGILLGGAPASPADGVPRSN